VALKQELIDIVGPKHVRDDVETLEKYSKDHSIVQARRPSYVVYPKNTNEVQSLVKLANNYKIPLVPRSSSIGFYGAGIPLQGGIVVDLTKMNKIIEVDAKNKKVQVEPGVTWEQVQTELGKQELIVSSPLLPHPQKSALTSALEREPIVIPKSEYGETLLTGEVVLPNGELFWLGSALGKGLKGRKFPEGMIPSTRAFTGAQGTLGILTWANIKLEYSPKMDELFFIPFAKAEDLIEPIYKIQHRMLGRECLVLNNLNLANILCEDWPDEFQLLRKNLPQFTLILCLYGLDRRPAERIAYEREALMEIASELHFEVLSSVGGKPGIGKIMLNKLRNPWDKEEYWKFRYKGSCLDIFFHTTLNRVPEFRRVLFELAAYHNYSTQDIGFYLQPLEYGRACYCQYNLYYDPNDDIGKEKVKNFYLQASEEIINMGGFFSTPYGPWAEMVYRRSGAYSYVARIFKDAVDPNNIMNPGKLCF
jgi:hypothetical protein